MNRAEFGQGLALLTGVVGKPMPDEQIAGWFAMLKDLTAEQFQRGIVETLNTHQFAGFPPIGTVRTNALAGTAGTMPPQDRPMAAWLAVRDAIRRVGAYDSPNFADPVINAVIRDLGGWPLICDTPTNKMQWVEKQFRDAYTTYLGAALKPHQTKRLAGITEIDNSRNGYSSEPVRVAEVACLTVQSDQVEPVRMRLETTEQASTLGKLRTSDAVENLARKLPTTGLETGKEFPPPDDPPKPQPVAGRDAQIAALKRLANQQSDQSKAG